MTYAEYSGSAEQYIREYLDPDGTLNHGPTSPDEARDMWERLQSIFAADGGAGISKHDFVEAVARMQNSAE